MAGAARRREVRLGAAGSAWGHGGAGRWWLRVVPVGVGRGSSPRVAVVGGLRRAAARRVGSVPLRSAAPVGGLPRMRGADVSKPNPALHLTPPCSLDGTAPWEGAVQVSCSFGNPEGMRARAAALSVWSAVVSLACRASRGAGRCWRGSSPRGAVGRGRRCVGTRRFGSVALRVVPVGRGAARRRV
ncbi:hypothetical protein C1280_27590 [Gemmata obscuriglobus]|uniref:Uncharacterized protein n=1 Tax=Gemmata obscuriglobus TaxID=114 RepID=A0A2Z3H7L4_9BACT|nr:hypothetical protein C1280_27590 [Gemmata obscuriglobus]